MLMSLKNFKLKQPLKLTFFFLVVAVKVVGNNLIADHEADAFNPPELSNKTPHLLEFLLRGFKRWDSIHFLHIAQFGYVYEHSTAFFPLLPLLINLLTQNILNPILNISNVYLTNILGGVLLNLIFFNLASIYLFKLTNVLFNNNKVLSILTVCFFSLNPASVFFSAVYSESLYSLLTFSGLFYLHRQNLIFSLVLFGLSSFCRSNGVLNSGFVGFILVKKHCENINANNISNLIRQFFKLSIFANLKLAIKLVFSLLAIFSGVGVYQFYVYQLFCEKWNSDIKIPIELIEYANKNNYSLISDDGVSREWCFRRIPMSYNYVQSTYWNVGFFHYWQIKQIPNFFIAFPVVFLSFKAIKDYFQSMNAASFIHSILSRRIERGKHFRRNSNLFPYALHLCALLISAVFFMHVQVSTRFIFSSNPFIYWFLADLLQSELATKKITWSQLNQAVRSKPTLKFAYYYFISYSFIGTLLFVNFYPFT